MTSMDRKTGQLDKNYFLSTNRHAIIDENAELFSIHAKQSE